MYELSAAQGISEAYIGLEKTYLHGSKDTEVGALLSEVFSVNNGWALEHSSSTVRTLF